MPNSSSHIASVIVGCGTYLPEKILTNDDLSTMVDTNDAWIAERTGIKQRHIAAEGEMPSDMAAAAAREALKNANLTAEDIDLILVATTTPDNTFPSTATRVQHLLGMTAGAAFDVQAVCSGFLYALSTAHAFIQSRTYTRILVIGAEALSRVLDWDDRTTCVLFGDGAGAVILEAQEGEEQRGILSCDLYSDGSTRDLLYVNGGPGSTGAAGVIKMQGKDVFKHATQKMVASTLTALEKHNLTVADVDWVIPHQANIRILEATIKRLEVPAEKLIATVDKHANTSAASIPLALHTALHEKKLKTGDLIALQAVGGGLTWAACLLRW